MNSYNIDLATFEQFGYIPTRDNYNELAAEALSKRIHIDDGKYPEMPDEHYINADALSYGSAKQFLRTPIHAVDKKVRPYLYADIDQVALDRGKALHYLILEPERFHNEIFVLPQDAKKPTSAQLKAAKPSPKTIAQIEQWTLLEQQMSGKIVLPHDTMADLAYMAESVYHKKAVRKVMRAGLSEFVFIHTIDLGEDAKCQIKVKIDKMMIDPLHKVITIVDLKSTSDASYGQFSRSIANFSYDIQMAMMDACVKEYYPEYRIRILFIAVEHKAPFGSALYSLELDALDNGYKQLYLAMRRSLGLKESGDYHDYDDGILPITIPQWAKK